jgi:hypothetical protein
VCRQDRQHGDQGHQEGLGRDSERHRFGGARPESCRYPGDERPGVSSGLRLDRGGNAALLKTTTVRVDTVKCTVKTTATVAYTLVLSGKAIPGLAPPGNAVLDAGAWKATKSTIGDLFALSNPALTQSGPCAA